MSQYAIHEVGGAVGGEAYLVVTPESSALLDTGFAFCAPRLISNIKDVLGRRPLDYVLLSHSHYDHASGSGACAAEWPQAHIAAHPHTATTLTRPSAVESMRRLNRSAAQEHGVTDYDGALSLAGVDMQLAEGDVIDLGSLKLRMVGTPGHTRDCISFCSDDGLLLASETVGTPLLRGMVMPGALVGYQMTIDSTLKCQALHPQRMLLHHYGVIEGDACGEFFKSSLYWMEKTRDATLEAWAAGANVSSLVQLQLDIFLEAMPALAQPMDAFLLNADIRARMILRELLGLSPEQIAERD